jgi:hypothetical protein
MKRIGLPLLLSLLAFALALPAVTATQEPSPEKAKSDKDGPETATFGTLYRAKKLPADPKDDELRKLLKERYNEVVNELEAFRQQYEASSPRATIEKFHEVASRLVEAKMDLCDMKEEKVKLLTELVAIAEQSYLISKAYYEAGTRSVSDLSQSRQQVLTAKIQLVKAKRETAKGKEEK